MIRRYLVLPGLVIISQTLEQLPFSRFAEMAQYLLF
jgi:hypothetical protein